MATQTEKYSLVTLDKQEAIEFIDYTITLLEDAGFEINHIQLGPYYVGYDEAGSDVDQDQVMATVEGSREYKKNE